MKTLIVAAFALLLIPSASFATQKNIWTQCGIGALIFKETGWAAAISNIIWDLGTTASSSTSTSPEQCAGKGSAAAKFINETYANLEVEMAAGQGEHLVTALNILGCEENSHGAIIKDLRSDFADSVSDPAYSSKSKVEKSEAFFLNMMNKVENQHASSCNS